MQVGLNSENTLMSESSEDKFHGDSVKTTIECSSASERILTTLVEMGYFESNTRAFRFAVSLALGKNLELPSSNRIVDKEGQTWGTLQMDPHQHLRILVNHILYQGQNNSQKEIYKIVELLAEVGLTHIESKINQGLSIYQIISE